MMYDGLTCASSLELCVNSTFVDNRGTNCVKTAVITLLYLIYNFHLAEKFLL